MSEKETGPRQDKEPTPQYPDMHSFYPEDFPPGYKVDELTLARRAEEGSDESCALPDNATMEFYFIPHELKSDAPDLGAKIKQSDIVILEYAGFTPETLELFNAVSKGNAKKLSQARQVVAGTEFQQWELDCLYNSHKKVLIVDLPADDKYEQFLARAWQLPTAYYARPTLAEATEFYKKQITMMAEMEHYRENSMIKNMQEAIPAAINQNPKLAKKEDVRILYAIGMAHTNLFHRVKASPESRVTRTFSSAKPVIYGLVHECLRKIARGDVPANDLFADAYIENVLRSIISPIANDRNIDLGNKDALWRKTILEMTPETKEQIAKDIFAIAHNTGEWDGEPALPVISEKIIQAHQPN